MPLLIAARRGPWFSGARRGRCLRLGLLLVMVLATGRAADYDTSREYQLKAVFLYNFGRFVTWPPAAFPAPTSPFIIGVLGQDPFGAALDQAVQGEAIEGHPLAVQRYRRVADARDSHILFISASEAGRIEEVVAALAARPVLTVCDGDRPGWRGVMIHFRTENRRIHLQINLAATKVAGLTVSSKLLRPAEIVAAEGPP